MAVSSSVNITKGFFGLLLVGAYFLDLFLIYLWVFHNGAWFSLSQKAKDIVMVVLSVGILSFVPVLNIIIVPSLFIYYYANKSAWEPAVNEIVAATSSTKMILVVLVVIFKSFIIQSAYIGFIRSRKAGNKSDSTNFEMVSMNADAIAGQAGSLTTTEPKGGTPTKPKGATPTKPISTTPTKPKGATPTKPKGATTKPKREKGSSKKSSESITS